MPHILPDSLFCEAGKRADTAEAILSWRLRCSEHCAPGLWRNGWKYALCVPHKHLVSFFLGDSWWPNHYIFLEFDASAQRNSTFSTHRLNKCWTSTHGLNKRWTWILTNPSEPSMLVVQTFGCVCPCQVTGLRREAVRAVRKQPLASWSGTLIFLHCFYGIWQHLSLHYICCSTTPFCYKKGRPYVVLTYDLIKSAQELASPAFFRFIIVTPILISCICQRASSWVG